MIRPPGDSPLPVFDLGTAPYQPIQELQAHLRHRVAEGSSPGALLLLEHWPVITLGPRASTADVLSASGLPSGNVPVVRSERGGKATLHAPGQLISYPIMHIPRRNLRAYVYSLEEILIRVLGAYGISASRNHGRPG